MTKKTIFTIHSDSSFHYDEHSIEEIQQIRDCYRKFEKEIMALVDGIGTPIFVNEFIEYKKAENDYIKKTEELSDLIKEFSAYSSFPSGSLLVQGDENEKEIKW